MKIYPAIDIKGGACVRLRKGNMNDATVYSDAPWNVAEEFQASGAKQLHVVNLDGAVNGSFQNEDAITKLLQSVSVPVELGGGIRSIALLEKAVNLGADRVILGTAALSEEFLKEAVKEFPRHIMVSIDAVNGFVATHGWTRVTSEKALTLAKRVEALGITRILYTDIAKDGMLSGPNFTETAELIEKTSLEVILSGGISSLEDVIEAKKIGSYGVILGRSLYEGTVSLKDVLTLEEGC